MGGASEVVRVGRREIPMSTAATWVREYTNAERNRTSRSPYAYPAYDHYDADRNDPMVLTDADLLAPTLLNVPVKIHSYYGLQRVRTELERGLMHPALETSLEEIEEIEEIRSVLRALYGVLDDPVLKPRGIKATTLSKILHRKRPKALVLHDVWVQHCYLGPGAPVARAKSRSWVDYMTEVSASIGTDVREQPEQFSALDAATDRPGTLTRIRLLDILAWKSKDLPASS